MSRAIALGLVLLIASCGYKIVGLERTGSYRSVEAVRLGSILDSASEPGFDVAIRSALATELTRRGIGAVAPESPGSRVLSGEALSYSIRPALFDENGLAREYIVTARARLWIENQTGARLREMTLTENATLPSASTASLSATLRERVKRELAGSIARRALDALRARR